MIDASGTWWTPNVLGATGLPGFGGAGAGERIDYSLPDLVDADRTRFAGRHTLVADTGHSPATTLLAPAELAEVEPGTQTTWVIRGADAPRTYGGGDADQLPARGALGTRVRDLVEVGRVRLVTGFFTHALRPATEARVEVSQDPDGEEQVRSIATARSGDSGAARKSELQLPETRVCSTNLTPASLATGIAGGLVGRSLASANGGGCCS